LILLIAKRLISSLLISSFILILSSCSLTELSSSTTATGSTATQNKTNPAPEGADSPTTHQNGELQVIFLDVGQGNAQLILTPNGKTMLIDGGNNGQEDNMFAYLKQYKIQKIDVLVGSHPDADHIGTFPEIIDAYEIERIYMPKITSNTKTFEALLLSIQRKGLKVNTAKAGITIPLDDDLTVQLLGPVNTYEESNEMSAVVKLIYGNTSFLFPGDAEYNSEMDLIKSGADLSADVLAVGHHGSNSSSNMKFIEKVHPEYAVIQVGAENKYGHPTEKTLQKLEKINAKILRTDQNGNITFKSNGHSIEVTTEK